MKQIHFCIAIVLSIVMAGCSISSLTGSDTGQSTQFFRLTEDIFRLQQQGIISVNGSQHVAFNREIATQNGMSTDSIQLATELVDLSNQLTTQSTTTSAPIMVFVIMNAETDLLVSYPTARMYFDEATKNHGGFEIKSAASDIVGAAVCGTWGNPKPRSVPIYREHFGLADPAATLRSWGYHETPGGNATGGGWTRDQQYHPQICGTNAFRDQGNIVYPRNGGAPYISEQNYEGFTPRGEPSPEVWRVSPWPYPLWPAYVFWWHTKGPGK